MGAEVIILANPYTYNFLKGLTHSAMTLSVRERHNFDFGVLLKSVIFYKVIHQHMI